MSPLIKIALFFLIILFISIGVYALVVKYFYWGDRDKPTDKND